MIDVTTVNELELYMGLRDKLFNKRQPQQIELPAMLEPEDPVNFDSVLDWVVGLSKADYDKFISVGAIYREANEKAAGVLGIKDKPTTTLKRRRLSDKQIDDQLDTLLETHPEDLKAAIAAEKPKPQPKKAQSPSSAKKVKA